MKTLVSVIIGIIVFALCLWGIDSLILYFISGMRNPDTKAIAHFIGWAIMIIPIVWVSAVAASIVGTIIYAIFESIESNKLRKKRTKEWEKQKKSAFQEKLESELRKRNS